MARGILMRLKRGNLVLGVLLLSTAQVWAASLPDSCGNDRVNFDIKLENDRPLPTGPESGKAQIVFIETLDKAGTCFHCISTTRVGVDGAWVGANQGNSYFAISVLPGEHNLCSDVQSKPGRLQLGMATLTAEPGKIYYYKLKLTWNELDGPSPYSDYELVPIGADEAKYRLKLSALSIFTPHS
jgi:hypothetical protein